MFAMVMKDSSVPNDRWGTSKLVIRNRFKVPYIMKAFQACMTTRTVVLHDCDVKTVMKQRAYQISPYWARKLAEDKDGISTLKKETFQNYFRSKVDDFDELLFSYISSTGGSSRNALELTNAEFVAGFEKFLERGSNSQHVSAKLVHDAGGSVEGKLELYFAIFSDGEPTMSFTDVVEMFHISKSLAVSLTTTKQGPKPEAETIADVWARSIMGEEGTHINSDRFCGWAKQNCPRVFDGIHYWMMKMLLYRGHSPGTVRQGFRGIPCVKEQLDSHSLLNTETLWILSTILPSCFISIVHVTQGFNLAEQQTITSDEKKPLEFCKEWGLLYNSQEHGQSLNRFKHHCMAYHGPTVTLLRIEKEELLVVAVDVEWRESSSSWGNSDCRIVQIRPKFRVLRAGPNLIFFNERARGLPSGIVLGQTSRPCVTLDTGLTSAKLHYLANLSPQTVKRIEVWGCGGQGVKEKQEKQQQWERKQAEKLQKVKRPGRWDDNPDKAIMEMAGVTTSHSQR